MDEKERHELGPYLSILIDGWLNQALQRLSTANLTSEERMHLKMDIAYRNTYEQNLKGEEKKEIAKAMLQDNEQIEKIARYTGLSHEVIKKLLT